MTHVIHHFEVFDQDLFDSRRTQVDITVDSVYLTWYEGEELCSYESWGEHGPNDFNDWGFRIKYTAE
jgi:hypothetical protein